MSLKLNQLNSPHLLMMCHEHQRERLVKYFPDVPFGFYDMGMCVSSCCMFKIMAMIGKTNEDRMVYYSSGLWEDKPPHEIFDNATLIEYSGSTRDPVFKSYLRGENRDIVRIKVDPKEMYENSTYEAFLKATRQIYEYN
jgi:hypothetical protein